MLTFLNTIMYVASNFSWTGLIFVGGDKLSPVIKHGFLRSEENVFPVISEHPQGVWENVFLYNFQYLCMVGVITIHVGRSYCLEDMNTLNIVTDVIANILWQMFKPLRQMLSPLLYMLGWCYCLLLLYVEDVIPHYLLQQLELADVIAKLLMELPLQGGGWQML